MVLPTDDDPTKLRRSLLLGLSLSIFVCQFQSDANVPATLFGAEEGFRNVNSAKILPIIWASNLYLTFRHFLRAYTSFESKRKKLLADRVSAMKVRDILDDISQQLKELYDYKEAHDDMQMAMKEFRDHLYEFEKKVVPCVAIFEQHVDAWDKDREKEHKLKYALVDGAGPYTHAFRGSNKHVIGDALKVLGERSIPEERFAKAINHLDSFKDITELKSLASARGREGFVRNVNFFDDVIIPNVALITIWIFAGWLAYEPMFGSMNVPEELVSLLTNSWASPL